MPVRAGRAVGVEEFGEPQLRLVRVGGQGPRAGVRVDDEEVDGVRAHVEDTKSHGVNASCI